MEPSRHGDVEIARIAAPLAVLRIIPGRAGAEYWTMRCTRCGGIHLDIVKPAEASPLTA